MDCGVGLRLFGASGAGCGTAGDSTDRVYSSARHDFRVGELGRIRDVREGPDGLIYLALEHADEPTSVVRLEPVPNDIEPLFLRDVVRVGP